MFRLLQAGFHVIATCVFGSVIVGTECERLPLHRDWIRVVFLIFVGIHILIGGVLGCTPSDRDISLERTATADSSAPRRVRPTLGTFPPTWTVTPTATALPHRQREPTLTPVPTATRFVVPSSTPVIVPLLTMPIPAWELEEESRLERIRVIESAAIAHHGQLPVAVLLSIAALESQGTFNNRIADHGVMGVTPKVGNCYSFHYENTAVDLVQNVVDASCHLNGYAWDRARGNDRNTRIIKQALYDVGYSEYIAQVVTSVHWYAGETQLEYLWVIGEIMDGHVDAARSVPYTFGQQYQNELLARAFRIGYHALASLR